VLEGLFKSLFTFIEKIAPSDMESNRGMKTTELTLLYFTLLTPWCRIFFDSHSDCQTI